jgi:hypothetical protein
VFISTVVFFVLTVTDMYVFSFPFENFVGVKDAVTGGTRQQEGLLLSSLIVLENLWVLL